MSVVASSPSVKPTALEMVNRVLREVGVEEVSSLSPGNPRSKLVLECLNDGVWDIHSKVLWPWAKTKYTINLVAGQSDYVLPQDFRAISLPLTLWNAIGGASSNQMIEYSPEEYAAIIPNQYVSNGTPYCYTVRGSVLTVYPAPTSNSITTYPQAQFEYFKWPQRRLTISDDNNTFDVPIELTQTLVLYGKSYLEKFLEYPDWKDTKQLYEDAVQGQLHAARQTRRLYRMRQKYDSNWWI